MNNQSSWTQIFNKQAFLKFLTLCLAVWLHAASSMLAATILPSATNELGDSFLINWAFTLYYLGSILAGASSILISRRIGLKNALMIAAVLYGLGCVVSAISPNMEVLLLGRLLQGTGGGSLVALSYIAIARFFPSELMPKLNAFISAVWSISAFCGPLLGGTFATFGLWRFAFWSLALQAVILIWAIYKTIENTGYAKNTIQLIPLILRLTTLALAILLMAYAGAKYDILFSPLLCLLSVILLIFFYHLDNQTVEGKILPKNAFSIHSKLGNGFWLVLLISISSMSFVIYGPFILQFLYHQTPLVAGYIVVLESIGWGIAAIAFSSIGKDIKNRQILVRTGTLLVSLTLIGFSFILSDSNLFLISLCSFFSGVGFGMMWGYIIYGLIQLAPEAEKDNTASAFSPTQQVGFALGSAIAGIIANSLGFGDDIDSMNARLVAFWIFIGFTPLLLFANIAAWRHSRK